MLTVFGSINIDQVIRVPSIPAPGETTLGERVMDTHGGKGANQAVAAARAGSGDVPVAMVGALGDDGHAQDALANFHANGVRPECVTFNDCSTGTAIITVSESGENAITVVPGANGKLTHEHASDDILRRTATLLCQGEVPLTESLRVMEKFRAVNGAGSIVMNLAPAPGERDVATLRDILHICDILIVNEHEALAISRLVGASSNGEQGIAAEFNVKLIETLGADGATLFLPDGGSAHVASPSVDPVDTTGAGDTFCGVFAVLTAEGQAIETAMQNACAAAALSCGAVGAQNGMPRRAAFMREAGPK